MKQRLMAFTAVFCFLLSPALPAFAAQPSIETALAALHKQIERDEDILTRPANITATKLARAQLAEGLRSWEFIIARFELRFAETEPKMLEDLRRLYADERAEAEETRRSHREMENTRNMVERNLPLKKAILSRARELVDAGR